LEELDKGFNYCFQAVNNILQTVGEDLFQGEELNLHREAKRFVELRKMGDVLTECFAAVIDALNKAGNC